VTCITRSVILVLYTGTDDAVAIMLAALHPGLELLGVTTVFGNLPVENTTDNTLRVLAHLGRQDIGVYAGAAGPLAPRPVSPDDRRLPPALALPEPTTRARPQPAVDWLVDTLATTTEPVTLVATGPFTNVAAALDAEPSIAEAIELLVLMGGAHRVPGVTPLAERNVWNDPAAAERVLTAGLDVVLITLDATSGAPLTAADADELDALGTPAGTASAAFLRERIGQYAGSSAPGAAPLHDPFTVAWLVEPSIVELTPASVRIDTAEGPAYGRTVIDLAGVPNARIALTADPDALRRLLLATFA
jgi:inosine-uridine nucleoside N-ribohydrolase